MLSLGSRFLGIGTLCGRRSGRRTLKREKYDVANAGRTGEHHDQPVDPDSQPTGGRHPVFQGQEEVVVTHRHGFVLTGQLPLKVLLLHQRVELNALASDEMVKWIETKLDENGITKVIPDDDTLTDAFKNRREQAVIQEKLEKLLDELKTDEDVEVPADLRDLISERLRDHPTESWEEVVREIADADGDDSDDTDEEEDDDG